MYKYKNNERNETVTSGIENPVYNINFVKAVEKYPCLWNYTLTEYSKRKLTEKAWKEVANEIEDTPSSCRDRWRNIRGAFLRSLKNIPNGCDTGSKRKYYLNDYLKFLLPYLKCKPENLEAASGSSDHFDDTNSDYEEQIETEELLEFQAPPNDIPVITEFNNPLIMEDSKTREISADKSANVVNKFKKRKLQTLGISANAVDNSFIEWFQSKRSRENNHEDPNMSFFRSLLPDISKMTDKQNRRFRQKVIGLVDDILEDADIHTHYSSMSNLNSVSAFRHYPTPSPSNYVNTSMSSPKYLPSSPPAIPSDSAQDAVPNSNEWFMKNEGDFSDSDV